MPVIARDAVASDHLVYAWPFPIGPDEYEVACADDELVVMCPAWLVGDRLGPGRHRWRTPDPMRPVSAYFVLTAPVEVSFDMTTQFIVPTTGQPVRLRGSGSLQVRCTDPALLIAQFVGLPFDHVNDGVLRSVSRSVERMLARLLTRRVVMSATPAAVTDPSMLQSIVEELVAYNPAAGAVFGVELVRMGHLSIYADDGSQPLHTLRPNLDWSGSQQRIPQNGDNGRAQSNPNQQFPHVASRPDIPVPVLETARMPRQETAPLEVDQVVHVQTINPTPPPGTQHVPPPLPPKRTPSTPPQTATSGEIVVRPKGGSTPPPVPPSARAPTPPPTPAIMPAATPVPRRTPAVEVPQSTDDITQPGVQIIRTPAPGSLKAPAEEPVVESRGSIMGIGMSHIGGPATTDVASGEIPTKIRPGGRVLVPGPNGLMQSATVRQLLQGYYELEVGGSGETIWVPMAGVVPE